MPNLKNNTLPGSISSPSSLGKLKSKKTGISENALYLIKIRAISENGTANETDVHLDLGYQSKQKSFISTRTINLKIPIVSDSDTTYGQRGTWYEQILFFKTDHITNTLAWTNCANAPCNLVVRIFKIMADYPHFTSFKKTLTTMARKWVNFNGKRYYPFLGIKEALHYLAEQTQSIESIQLPKLKTPNVLVETATLLIALVGDDMLEGLLNTSFTCIKIMDEESIPLISMNVFDLILLQKRAVGISAPGISSVGETRFLTALTGALSQTTVPILELETEEPTSMAATLRPIRNSELKIEVRGSEYEFAQFCPIRGEDWNARTIAIPCASDLYQYQDFLDTAKQLVKSGYGLAISESNFDHQPIRTWERLKANQVKVYGRLSISEQAELFHNCNFVLLPGETLRRFDDIVNLTVMALMCGALPIVLGKSLPPPLSGKAESIWGYATLHDYLSRHTSFLQRERHWITRFRSLLEESQHGNFREALTAFAVGRQLVRNRQASPMAEMICVSKRIENIPKIIANFKRQSYSNLSLHLILNVPTNTIPHGRNEIEKLRQTNIQTSILDESHNIGCCLNHGIRNSDADYWFKIDDDDYYGTHYITDLINYYKTTNCDAVGKPSAFISLNSTSKVYLRNHSPSITRRWLAQGAYFCGATLSGPVSSDLPMFSPVNRNSCDSKWIETLQTGGFKIAISDLFNFCIQRGNPEMHTWQIDNKRIEDSSWLIADLQEMEWIDAL